MLTDFRLAVRSLTRSWHLTLVVVASLGAAIAANATVFGAMYALFERRLPIANPDEVVAVQPINRGMAAALTYTQFRELKRLSGVADLAAYRPEPATIAVSENAEAEPMWIEAVSGDYFGTLGVQPLVGRTLSAADESDGNSVAVVSEHFWRQTLGADPRVVGSSFFIDGRRFLVVGVMPREFSGLFFAHAFAIAIPLSGSPSFGGPEFPDRSVSAAARLPHGPAREKTSASIAHAFDICCSADFGSTDAPRRTSQMLRSFGPVPDSPPLTNAGTAIDTLTEAPHIAFIDASRGLTWGVDLRAQYQRSTAILTAGASLLLMIACANVATIFATRSTRRRRELATRLAIGATRFRLIRQALAEGIVLSTLGVIAGLVGANLITGFLIRSLPSASTALSETLRWRAHPALFGYSAVVALVCTVACAVC